MELEILQVCVCENRDRVNEVFGPAGKIFKFIDGDETVGRLLEMEKNGEPVARLTGDGADPYLLTEQE